MRIATSQLYDAPKARLTDLTGQADKLQAQIATGKRVATASDDAAAWSRLEGLKRDDADDTAFSGNVKLAQGLLAQADSTLGSVQNQIQRAQEIAVQAANGTLNPTDRAALGTELDSIVDDLMSLANSRDSRGQPLFGGADGATPFVRGSDGTIGYVGTGEPSPIAIGQDTNVSAGTTGDRAFGDMFATLHALGTALAAGTPPPAGTTDGLAAAADRLATARTSIGARAIRVDLQADRLTDAGAAREETRTTLDGVDTASAITELQKTLTILQATQASFSKLSGMSLFDYLR